MKLLKNSSLLFLTALTVIVMTSCRDNPVGTNDDDHSDAEGYALVLNNAEIFRFENNQYQLDPTGTWGDYFRVINGVNTFVLSPDVVSDMSRGMTPVLRVRWIDDDGDLFDLPEELLPNGEPNPEGEYRLEWDWEKPLVQAGECSPEARGTNLDAIRPANIEQHGSDGSWGFHFRGDHAGTDRIRFHLMHGDHSDFTSGWLNVVVADDDHELIDENGVWNHERNKCRIR